jgi:hypothetical protein
MSAITIACKETMMATSEYLVGLRKQILEIRMWKN